MFSKAIFVHISEYVGKESICIFEDDAQEQQMEGTTAKKLYGLWFDCLSVLDS